jgi:hypothetical protein
VKSAIQNVLISHSTCIPLWDPINNIGTSTHPSDQATTKYTVHLDDGTTAEVSLTDLVSPASVNGPLSCTPDDPFINLPMFLSKGSKITFHHNGSFQKGFLEYSPEHRFQFVMKRNLHSIKVDYMVPLPDFKHNGPSLVGNNIVLPGHSTVSSFRQPNSFTNAPLANFVSVIQLLGPCPQSLQKALHPSNTDRDTWLQSYMEDTGGLEWLNVYGKINKNNVSKFEM